MFPPGGIKSKSIYNWSQIVNVHKAPYYALHSLQVARSSNLDLRQIPSRGKPVELIYINKALI